MRRRGVEPRARRASRAGAASDARGACAARAAAVRARAAGGELARRSAAARPRGVVPPHLDRGPECRSLAPLARGKRAARADQRRLPRGVPARAGGARRREADAPGRGGTEKRRRGGEPARLPAAHGRARARLPQRGRRGAQARIPRRFAARGAGAARARLGDEARTRPREPGRRRPLRHHRREHPHRAGFAMNGWWTTLSFRERAAVLTAAGLVFLALLILVAIEPAWRTRARLTA